MGTNFKGTSINRVAISLALLLTIVSVLPGQFLASSMQQPQALALSFVYLPKFVLVGDSVNFTALVSGGTPPYTISWNFGDGNKGAGVQIFHTFTSPGTYNVQVNATDSTSQKISSSSSVAVQEWPVTHFGWLIRWNITANDGINIWNVTYKGVLVIRDARIPGIQVLYRDNLCGPFYDEPTNETRVREDGNIFYENSTGSSNPYFQIRAEYRVGGYYYQETFRFYPTGRFDTELTIARGGCAFDHIYEPHFRVELAMGNDSREFMSMYTPSGAWQDLFWDGNYTDNGFRDPTHNGAEWRIGDQGRYYYIAPTIIRADLDLPYIASNLILLRDHPGQIELSHPELGIEDPTEFINGELAFRVPIVFWFIPRIWDHGPVNTAPLKDITLSFNPYGSWP